MGFDNQRVLLCIPHNFVFSNLFSFYVCWAYVCMYAERIVGLWERFMCIKCGNTFQIPSPYAFSKEITKVECSWFA